MLSIGGRYAARVPRTVSMLSTGDRYAAGVRRIVSLLSRWPLRGRRAAHCLVSIEVAPTRPACGALSRCYRRWPLRGQGAAHCLDAIEGGRYAAGGPAYKRCIHETELGNGINVNGRRNQVSQSLELLF